MTDRYDSDLVRRFADRLNTVDSDYVSIKVIELFGNETITLTPMNTDDQYRLCPRTLHRCVANPHLHLPPLLLLLDARPLYEAVGVSP